MRNFLMGFIVGAVIFTLATAWAAFRVVLVDGGGTELGTTSNPVIVQSV